MVTSARSALWDKRAAVQNEIETFLAATDGRVLTAEEDTKADSLQAELSRIDGSLKRQDEMQAILAGGPSRPAITGGHDRLIEQPFGFKTYNCTLEEFIARNPRQMISGGKLRPAASIYMEAGLGEYLQGIAAGYSGRGWDPRFVAGPSGASEGVPADGGLLVRQEYSTMLLDRAIEQAVLAPLCLTVEIGANSDGVDLPFIDETSRANGSRWGGVQVYWRAEADTVTATKPKFGQHDVRLQELMGLAYATDRLIKDATALASIFSIAFASEMAFKLDDGIFRGNGAGLPLGITNSASCRISQAKETGQTADTIVLENLQKMWTRVPPRSKARGQWLINSEVTPQLDSLVLNAGTAGLNPRVVTYSESGVQRIYGRPILEIEQCAALGDEGDIVFADFNEYLLIRKGGIQADESMHVRFLYGENTYRWTYRVNGRPTMDSAITPYKTNTSNTQSPFVALAARA